MNNVIIASELIKIAKELIAIEFPTQEAMDKYLKDHPDADKANHRVVKSPAKVELELNEKGLYKEPTSWSTDYKKEPVGQDKENLDMALRNVGATKGKILRHYGDLFVMETDGGKRYTVNLTPSGQVKKHGISRR